jgi:5-methylthioadenosine/S-adenosylhomocysteine deaminase
MLNNIVYSASGSDILLTVCDGQVLYKNGEYLTLDVEKIKYEAEKAVKKILASL